MELVDVYEGQGRGGGRQETVTIERNTIRSTLKCLVNIYSSSSQSTNDKILRTISTDTQLGLDLKMLAMEDDIMSFYVKILGIE